MIQQVNLYSDDLRRQQTKSGANPYWLSLLVAALLLACVSAYMIWHLKSIELEVQDQTRILAAEQTKNDFLSAQLPKQELDAQLAAEVARQQNMLAELTHAAQLLSGRVTDRSPGFSSYFLALANQSIPEVWIKALYFNGRQQIINIEGSTFKPEKVPYFLQQLQKEPIFNGHSFAKLIMQKTEAAPEQIDFKLSTTLESSQ